MRDGTPNNWDSSGQRSNRPRRLSMLTRKLWADSRALASQTVALMILICLGVALYVGLYEAYQNLEVVYDTIYKTTRFADASALFDAAPAGLVDKVRTIPHVRTAFGRAVKDGAIIQRGRERERVLGRFIGLPRGSRPPVNDVMILDGRFLSNAQEVMMEQQFAHENGYVVGDRVRASYQGREYEFVICALVASPEYIYPVPSKYQMFFSRGTFGVLFIDEARARQWFGMGRQITEVHCLTDPGYEQEVVDKLEGLTRGFGLDYAYIQDEQPSKKLLEMDQAGYAVMSFFFPVLFLGSAGLSLYGALNRIIRLQVPIIGTLRASGFSRREILWHYVGENALVALGGAIPGAALGHWMAIWINQEYVRQLMLPMGSAAPHWDTLSAGLIMATLTGLVGAWLPARMAANVPPAVALRGEVVTDPAREARGLLLDWTALLPVLYRIPLRGLLRQASRTVFAIAGIAGGVCIMITTFGMYVSVMDAIDEYLHEGRRYEVDLQFTTPQGTKLAEGATVLDGARSVGLTVGVPLRVHSSWGSGEVMCSGVQRGQRLTQPRTLGGEPMRVRAGELWLPKQLARKLRVEPGDPIYVEWVKSSRRRPVHRTMRVAGILDLSMGATAYGEYNDIRRGFADRIWPESSFGAALDCDPRVAEQLKHRFERSQDVALVSTTADVRREIDQQMGLMYVFIGILLSFGMVLAGSTIHSIAGISLLERTRELASLRTLGFSLGEVAKLAGLELLLLSIGGLIVGLPLGAALNTAFLGAFQTESMAYRSYLPPWVFVASSLLVFALVGGSTYAGARRLGRMDLAQATKARE